jgi:hypothetical protein
MKKLMAIFLFIFISLSINDVLAAPALVGKNAPVTWTAPITNTDGTALTNLAGFRLYWGTTAGTYTTSRDIGNVKATTLNVLGIFSGNWFMAVTAYDTTGNESGYSNEYNFFLRSPNPPTNLRIGN